MNFTFRRAGQIGGADRQRVYPAPLLEQREQQPKRRGLGQRPAGADEDQPFLGPGDRDVDPPPCPGRKGRLSALRAHTKAPYKMNFHRKTLRNATAA